MGLEWKKAAAAALSILGADVASAKQAQEVPAIHGEQLSGFPGMQRRGDEEKKLAQLADEEAEKMRTFAGIEQETAEWQADRKVWIDTSIEYFGAKAEYHGIRRDAFEEFVTAAPKRAGELYYHVEPNPLDKQAVTLRMNTDEAEGLLDELKMLLMEIEDDNLLKQDYLNVQQRGRVTRAVELLKRFRDFPDKEARTRAIIREPRELPHTGGGNTDADIERGFDEPGVEGSLDEGPVVLVQAIVDPKEVGRDTVELGKWMDKLDDFRKKTLGAIDGKWEDAARWLTAEDEKLNKRPLDEQAKIRFLREDTRKLYRRLRAELLLGRANQGADAARTLGRRYNREKSPALKAAVRGLIAEIQHFFDNAKTPEDVRGYAIREEEVWQMLQERQRNQQPDFDEGRVRRT